MRWDLNELSPFMCITMQFQDSDGYCWICCDDLKLSP